MYTLYSPGRLSKTDNNADIMIYAAMLTKNTTPYDLNKNIPPKSFLKRNLRVSYEINAINDFPNMTNTKE